MRIMTDEFAFALSPEGWNYYCDLLSEYQRDPGIALHRTRFFRFFQSELVRSVRYLNDLLYLHDSERRSRETDFKFYLGTWPWGGLTIAQTFVGGTPFGWYYDQVEGKLTASLWGYGRNLWYRPGDPYTLEFEWNLMRKQYQSLKRGYYPLLRLSFPSVTLLVRSDGEKRGIIVDGHHRLAILRCLEYDQLTVEVVQVVEEAQVDGWYYVKRGDCTRKQALEIFNAFFVINGSERRGCLDLDRTAANEPGAC
jgi:hypothetical protein